MTPQQNEALARSSVYGLLSLGYLYPEKEAVDQLKAGVQKVGRMVPEQGWQEVSLALNSLNRDLNCVDDQGLESQYIKVFGHTVSTDCPPYEGEYGQAHVFQKSHTLADLRAFYNAFGVAPNPELKERQDHISVEMEFMSLLALKEAYALRNNHGEDKVALCRRAQESFLSNHLANWVGIFAQRLTKKAGGEGVYVSLAHLLNIHMTSEFQRFHLDATPLSLTKVTNAMVDDSDRHSCPVSANTTQEVVGQCE